MRPATTDPDAMADGLRRWASDFDVHFAQFLDTAEEVPGPLVAAVRYSALAPGKRLRPYLVVRWCELSGRTREEALPAAAAVECVHAFSLVHDDLPAMDDDDLRRGRPTTHKQFGEALAILAGDALLALSFELITRRTPDPRAAAAMVLELARGSGWQGMIGGQAADVLGEGQPVSRQQADYVHSRKTARLFRAACRIGVLAAGGRPELREAAGQYGECLGRAFQIADDLLDVTATADQMGKGVGKDAASGKQTYPASIGVAQSRAAAAEAAGQAGAALESLGREADDLRALALFVVQRQH